MVMENWPSLPMCEMGYEGCSTVTHYFTQMASHIVYLCQRRSKVDTELLLLLYHLRINLIKLFTPRRANPVLGTVSCSTGSSSLSRIMHEALPWTTQLGDVTSRFRYSISYISGCIFAAPYIPRIVASLTSSLNVRRTVWVVLYVYTNKFHLFFINNTSGSRFHDKIQCFHGFSSHTSVFYLLEFSHSRWHWLSKHMW